MAKKVIGLIKLEVPAGAANPSPPIGPALGQRGLNIMEFCKAFNAQTQNMEKGMPIPVVITAYADRSFTFITKTPPASFFLKKAAGLPKGGSEPGVVNLSWLMERADGRVFSLVASWNDPAQDVEVDKHQAITAAAVRLLAGHE